MSRPESSEQKGPLHRCNPVPLFHRFDGVDADTEFVAELLEHQPFGRQIRKQGKEDQRDPFDVSQTGGADGTYGKISLGETVFTTADEQEPWLGCITELRLNPGSSYEGTDWKLDSAVVVHDWGENASGNLANRRGCSQATGTNQINIQYRDSGPVRWQYSYDSQGGSTTIIAGSIAKLTASVPDTQTILRTSAQMTVSDEKPLFLQDTRSVGTIELVYKK